MKHIRKLAILGFLTLWSGIAQAAKVNAISVPKLMVSLSIDPGETFKAREKLCLLDEKQAKLACGVVAKVKGGSKLIVKIGKRDDLARLKKGATLRLKKMGSPANSDATEEMASSGVAGGKNPFRLAVNYDAALVMPASYNQVTYSPPKDSPPDKVLTPDTAVSSQFLPFDTKFKIKYVGVVGEIGIPLGSKMLSLGGRYQAFQTSSVESDYDTGLQDPFVRTLTTANAFGVWTDFTVLKKFLGKSLSLNIFSGAGFDQYSVTVRATKVTSPDNAAAPESSDNTAASLSLVDPTVEGAPIITGTVKLGLISLRAGARLDFQLAQHFGLSLGGTAVVPLAAPLNSVSVDVGDGEDRGVADSQVDLKKAVNLLSLIHI